MQITDPDHPLHHIFLKDMEPVYEILEESKDEFMRLLTDVLCDPEVSEMLDELDDE